MTRFSLSNIKMYVGQLLAVSAVTVALGAASWSPQVLASSAEELKNFKAAVRAKYDIKERAFAMAFHRILHLTI